jgi:hypothetical protein
MIKRLVSILALVALLPLSAHAMTLNPCRIYPHNSVAINISSATTTSLIAPVTGAPIYICSWDLQQAGGTGTLALEYGTGATCGTGTATLTGPLTANSGAGTSTDFSYGSGGEVVVSVPVISQRLCALSTGTIQQSGTINYVQPPAL